MFDSLRALVDRFFGPSDKRELPGPTPQKSELDALRPPNVAPEKLDATTHALLPDFPAFHIPRLEPLPSQFQTAGPDSYGNVLVRNRNVMTAAVKAHVEQLRAMSKDWVVDTLVDHVRYAHHTHVTAGLLGIHENRFNLRGHWDSALGRLSEPLREQIQSVKRALEECATILGRSSWIWPKDLELALAGGRVWGEVDSLRGLSRTTPEVALHFRVDQESYGTYQGGGMKTVALVCVTGWRTHFAYTQSFEWNRPSEFRSLAPQTYTGYAPVEEALESLLPHICRDLELLIAEKRVEVNDRLKLALNSNSPEATTALAEILVLTDWRLGKDGQSVLLPESRIAVNPTPARYGCSEALWIELKRLGMTSNEEQG